MNSRLLPLALFVCTTIFAKPALAADATAGAALYRDKGCAHCHGAHGEGTLKAPALVNIRTNKKWTPAKIRQQIMDGGQKMPPFADSLSDAEVTEIVTFLRSKHWPSPPLAAPSN